MDLQKALFAIDRRYYPIGGVTRSIDVGGTQCPVVFQPPTKADLNFNLRDGHGFKVGSRRYALRAHLDLQDPEGTFEFGYAQYWRFGSYHPAKPSDLETIRATILTAVREQLMSEEVRTGLLDEFARIHLRRILDTLRTSGAAYRHAVVDIAKAQATLPAALQGSIDTETGEAAITEEMLEAALEEMRTRLSPDSPEQARRPVMR